MQCNLCTNKINVKREQSREIKIALENLKQSRLSKPQNLFHFSNQLNECNQKQNQKENFTAK